MQQISFSVWALLVPSREHTALPDSLAGLRTLLLRGRREGGRVEGKRDERGKGWLFKHKYATLFLRY